jgi:excisionase family DNA binding protein
MLTSEEVREILGISQRTLFRLVKSGALAGHKVTLGPQGRYRFAEEDVSAYIRRNRVKPDKKAAAS